MPSTRTLARWALVATVFLVMLGGYTRGSGSGYGCADRWPLCEDGLLGGLLPRLEYHMIVEWTHRWVAAGIGVLFGLIGVAAAHAAAQSTGEKKTQDAQAQLRLDMRALAERVLTEELGRRGAANRFAAAGTTGAGSLEIVPYLVVNFIGDEQVRPWVVLKTMLKDAKGEEQWKTKYVAGVGEARPLGGERGWASEDGAPLRQHVDRNLRLAMDVLLRDASGTLPRGTGRKVEVKAQWVWVKPFLERTAEVLEETEDALVVIPDVADAFVFAGVNILDKRAVTVKQEEK